MKYKIEITGAKMWRHGRSILGTGVYRVPEDISEAMAQAALEEGAAVKVGKGPAPENKLAAVGNGTASRGRPSRGAGPASASPSSPAGRASRRETLKLSEVKRER